MSDYTYADGIRESLRTLSKVPDDKDRFLEVLKNIQSVTNLEILKLEGLKNAVQYTFDTAQLEDFRYKLTFVSEDDILDLYKSLDTQGTLLLQQLSMIKKNQPDMLIPLIKMDDAKYMLFLHNKFEELEAQ